MYSYSSSASVASSTSAASSVSIPRSSGCVTSPVAGAAGQRELRRVQQLDREPPPDLHLADVEGGIDAGSAARGPVAHAVGAVLLEQRERRHDVALRLRHLLAIGIEDPSRDRRVLPRRAVVLEVAAHHARKQPRADDVVRLRPQVHRKRAREQIGVRLVPAHDLRRHRRGRPRVHDVGIADEPAGLPALSLRCSRRAHPSTDRSAAATSGATIGWA